MEAEAEPAASTGTETLEQMQARHRKEQRDLQGRITSKKKNATKKTRKGVNDECAELERQLRERQAGELKALTSGDDAGGEEEVESEEPPEKSAGRGEEEGSGAVNGIASQLRETTLSPSPSPSTTGPAAGKKRNRQKERLARRAAEQEAAAAAAAEEAAGMVDHRGAEREQMERAFAARGLVEKEILPDGHCLFSAVADQLTQQAIPLVSSSSADSATTGDADEEGSEKAPPYRVVRRAAAGYIRAHADDFTPFLEEPLDTYVHRIRDTAEWGGHMELLALANTYGVAVHVVQAGGRTEVIQPTAATSSEKGGKEGKEKEIWLAYYRHGYGLGEHYNSLRKKP